ncbi:Tetratricopeptide repeat-containing protein [Catalinimonas alkaloidigena]|uniref:Tetratricopeptide repeat-containing protein n=1 Tax=Catalinimonas alkaloidigena TaxID=1075417 RepID=A0A1G9J2M1_9BACT|nr:tetratricopeptide repeat protein [Catalinimonas alkaloidigena]SDL31526.1 Tetratricopeptide repeat-containing protein [Catalinimonas alkaloidigena]
MKKSGILIGAMGWLLWWPAVAQDTLTIREGAEITHQAELVVYELEDLLNVITNTDIGSKMTQDLIRNSYSSSKNQIFYDEKVIIESDDDPDATLKNFKDAEVPKYLNTLDLYYEKSSEPSVSLTSVKTSPVKKSDYYYVRTYFERNFENKHKQKNKGYATVPRVADVRVDNVDGKWQARIIGISFFGPEEDLNTPENNVELIAGDDDVLGKSVASLERNRSVDADMIKQEIANLFAEEMRKLKEVGSAEETEKKNEYEEAIKMGDQAYAEKRYQAAKDAYEAAIVIYPYKYHPKVRLNEIARLTERSNQYEDFVRKAKHARSIRKYEDAITFYQKALELQPDQRKLNDEIMAISSTIREVSLPKNEMMAGDYDAAMKSCNKLIRTHSDHPERFPELFLMRGICYAKEDKTKQALKDFTDAISYDPQYLDAYRERGQLYAKSGELAQAVADYDVIVSFLPDDPRYLSERANLKRRMGSVDGAIDDYQKVIALAPSSQVYYEKAMLHYQQEAYRKALASLENAIHLDAHDGKMYFQRGLTQVRLQNYNEAQQDFTLALEKGLGTEEQKAIRQESEQLYREGLAALDQKAYDTALEILRNAAVLDPTNVTVWFKLGEVYELQRRYEDAIGAYTQIIEQEETNWMAWYKRGVSQLKLRSYDRAVNDLLRVRQLQVHYFPALVGLGDVYAAQRDFGKAIDEYEKAIATIRDRQKKDKIDDYQSRLADIYVRIGDAKIELADYKEAMEKFEEATKLDKKAGAPLFYRGKVYYITGDYDKALKDLSEAITLKYDNPEVRFVRALTYQANNDYPNAIKDLGVVMESSDTAEYPEAFMYRAMVYRRKTNNLQDALHDLETFQHRVVTPGPLFHTTLGLVQLDLNNPENAKSQFARARAAADNYGPAWLGEACLVAREAKTDEALALCEKAFNAGQVTVPMIDEAESTYLADLKKSKKYRKLRRAYEAKLKK